MDSSELAARDHHRSNNMINLTSNGSCYVQYMWLLITQPWGVWPHRFKAAFAFIRNSDHSLTTTVNSPGLNVPIWILKRQQNSIGIQHLIYQVWKGSRKNIRQHESLKKKKHTHSGSAIDAIRLPVRIGDVSGCSCNWSRLVQTGLSGNCKSNSNGKSYNVTQPSTPSWPWEQSALGRTDGRTDE